MTFEEQPIQLSECTEVYAQLYPFIDGALPGPQQQQLQAHLSICPPCAKAIEFKIGLKGLVQHRCTTDLPDGMRDRVFGQIMGDRANPFSPDSGPTI